LRTVKRLGLGQFQSVRFEKSDQVESNVLYNSSISFRIWL